MKHNLQVTLFLIGLFLVSQIVGLTVTSQYMTKTVVVEDNMTISRVTTKPLPSIGTYELERPEAQDKNYSFIPILFAVLFGTALLLLLIKLQWRWLWKVWFFFAVSYTLFIAFNPLVMLVFEKISTYLTAGNFIALLLAVGLAFMKVFRNNIYVQNLTEVFLYGGLAAIFFDFFNLVSVSIVLVLISLYDMFAVWQSRHMVKLAEFQTDSKVFAGLMIPYSMPKRQLKEPGMTTVKVKAKTAILGGGDMGFPLLFSAVILKTFGWGSALILTVFSTIALAWLLFKAEKDKFYPAMPFISAGCFVGLGIVYLLQFL